MTKNALKSSTNPAQAITWRTPLVRLWFLGSLFYLLQFILRASPNAMSFYLVRDFHISATALGLFASAYYWAYAALQIPLGMLLDRYHPQRILFAGTFLCLLGLICFAASPPHFPLALLGRFMMGAGAATGLLSTIASARHLFSAQNLPKAVSVTLALGNMGGILGNIGLAVTLQHVHWQRACLYLAAFTLILNLALWILRRHFQSPQAAPDYTSQANIFENLRAVFGNKSLVCLALYSGLVCLPLSLITDGWGVSFLCYRYGLSTTKAAFMVIFLFMGLITGAPLTAWLSDHVQKKTTLLTGYAFLSTTLCCFFLFLNSPIPLLPIFLFGIGFCVSAQTLVLPMAATFTTPNLASTATGFVNMSIMLGGALFHPIVGFCIDLFGTTLGLGIQAAYTWGLAIMPLFIALSAAFAHTLSKKSTLQKSEIL